MTVFYTQRHNERTWEREHAVHPDWEIPVNADRSYPVYGMQSCTACENSETSPDHASCGAVTTQVDPEWCECECWVSWKPSWRETVSSRIAEQPGVGDRRPPNT